MPTRRQSRVNELLRDVLSEVIHREVRDPRLAEVTTITEVSVSADLRSAKVYVSILGSDEDRALTLEGLRAAASFIRRGLKNQISLRYVPFLTFSIDTSIEGGMRLSQIMDEAAPEPATNEGLS